MKLNAKELRTVDEVDIQEKLKNLKRKPIYFILENIYDTYNIGGIFRLADAIGVSKMYLCGQMEIPPNAKIKKASIGTYKVVPWEYKKTAKEAIDDLRSEYRHSDPVSQHGVNSSRNLGVSGSRVGARDDKSIQIIAVEQDEKSIPYT